MASDSPTVVTDAARATAYRRVGAAAAAAFVALVLLGLARHVDAAPPMPASPQPSLQYPPPAGAAPTEPGDDDDQRAPRSPDGDGQGGRDRFGGGGAGEGRGRFGGGSDGGAPPSATPAPNTSGGATT
jgi:uncharacterized membrane protein YgcG